MEDKKVEELWKKYVEGTCTAEERKYIQSWYNKTVLNKAMPVFTDDLHTVGDEVWVKVSKNIEPQKSKASFWLWASSAAAVLLCIFSLFYFFQTERAQPISTTNTQHIAPSVDGAILTLADGREVVLNDQNNLSDYIAEDKELADEKFTVTTPKGKRIQIKLPDGSTAILNPLSTLSYLSSTLQHSREVSISGEIFFDVAKLKDKDQTVVAFVVKSKGQEVRVLGTRFSVANYEEDDFTKTTLEEGSVAVEAIHEGKRETKILKPGQQSILSATGIQVKEVDLDVALAWKDNDFAFRNQSLKGLLKQLERWYDVSFVWKNGKYENETFDGMIPRDRSIYEVLNALERTGKVKFEIQDRTILVK